MIKLENICKAFRVAKRQSGMRNAVKALFSREYETVNALSDISFEIGDGEMLGYIGPNGAGKSTTLKIMCGVLIPDSGSCVINGLTPWKDRIEHVRNIGVAFGQRSQLWWDVPVIDSFELLRDIYKVSSSEYTKSLDELTSLLNLEELLKTPARALSLGQRMRCEIAASLLHSPKILLLDEPTIGLDAVSKFAVRSFIKKRNAEHGTSVVIATHDMGDIEALADRILLIGKGRILLDGSVSDLKKKFSNRKTVSIEYIGNPPSAFEGVSILQARESHAVLSLEPEIVSVSDAISFLAEQTNLTDVSVSSISAEEMVAKLYSEYGI
ncbi:MAG: ATP-binding cassette domain-containing protein [Eubacteriaceae bacterium]|nr:ATP-binding cassette domain-containing protein [Eubacteriaceae bacterium]